MTIHCDLPGIIATLPSKFVVLKDVIDAVNKACGILDKAIPSAASCPSYTEITEEMKLQGYVLQEGAYEGKAVWGWGR